MRLTQIFAAAAIALVSTLPSPMRRPTKPFVRPWKTLQLEIPVESISAVR